MPRCRPLALICAFALCPHTRAANPYTDPHAAFALDLPIGWKTSVERIDTTIQLTTLHPAEDNPLPAIHILTVKSPAELDPKSLDEVAATLLKLGEAALQQDAKITSRQRSATKFNGHDAIRVDFTTRDRDDNASTARMIVTLGKSHALLISTVAPANDAAALKQADAVLATLILNPHPATSRPAATKPATTMPAAATRASLPAPPR